MSGLIGAQFNETGVVVFTPNGGDWWIDESQGLHFSRRKMAKKTFKKFGIFIVNLTKWGMLVEVSIAKLEKKTFQ